MCWSGDLAIFMYFELLNTNLTSKGPSRVNFLEEKNGSKTLKFLLLLIYSKTIGKKFLIKTF